MEVEIKLKVTEEIWKKTKEKLEKEGTNKKEKTQHDIYFSPVEPNFFGKEENDECLRIRVQKDKYILGYKKIIFGNTKQETHLIEHETMIENLNQMKSILENLHIHEIITLEKKRITYIYKNQIEISFDEVKDLGFYIELEVIDKKLEIKLANQLLKKTLENLDLDENDRDQIGYANALYNLKYRSK